MTNRQFDELVRRQIEMEDFALNTESENRLRRRLAQPVARPMARRRPQLRTLVLALLVLALLCGVAVAAITWGSREYLSYTDEKGTTHLNEELAAYAQPVDKGFRGDALSVNLIDAIFDGRSMVLTWTTQSLLTDTQAYILCDMRVNGEYMGQGSFSNADEIFIQPGEVLESGLSMRVDEQAEGDTCEVSMHFSVLTPNGEIERIGGVDGDGSEADYTAYLAMIDRLNAEGKVVVAPDGVIELGNKYPPYEEGMTRTDILTASGVMTLADTVDVSFTLENNAESMSALSVDGQPMEKDNGAYTLRVVKAEMTPNSATFELERVFQDEAAVKAFSAYYEKLGPFWGFNFLDETGDIWWANNSGGGGPDAPEKQQDGTWIWPYEATMTGIERTPKSITIVPYRDDPQSGEYHIPFPEEGMTISFGE